MFTGVPGTHWIALYTSQILVISLYLYNKTNPLCSLKVSHCEIYKNKNPFIFDRLQMEVNVGLYKVFLLLFFLVFFFFYKKVFMYIFFFFFCLMYNVWYYIEHTFLYKFSSFFFYCMSMRKIVSRPHYPQAHRAPARRPVVHGDHATTRCNICLG